MDPCKSPEADRGDTRPLGAASSPPPRGASPAHPPRVGDVLLGKYRVERELGRGGMGVVLAVRHIELDGVFALKVLLPGPGPVPHAADRFLREAKVTARLAGEHIAKVFDVGRLDGGRPYMLMEHLDGSDLKHVLAERGPLPIDEVRGHVLQACEAVAEAHAHGILHRDIKPSNLFLVKRSNGRSCVKVLDFGISKVLEADGADLTASGVVLGSPLYMSPEQMMRSKDVGMPTDVWALGCVLFELVTGKAAFAADSMTAVVGHVLHHDPSPPSHLRPGVPAWLDAVVARCLRKAPEDRYQTVDELAIALREGAEAAEPTTAETAVPAERGGAQDGKEREPTARPAERPAVRRRPTWLLAVVLGAVCVAAWLVRRPPSGGEAPDGSESVTPALSTAGTVLASAATVTASGAPPPPAPAQLPAVALPSVPPAPAEVKRRPPVAPTGAATGTVSAMASATVTAAPPPTITTSGIREGIY